ncbi:MAG: hypothetical protein QME96_16910, partial [Myxococcota bacterium]|nr:hypothetical protein [Myxococcota bacterium]
DLLQGGRTRKDARRIVHEALYDWRHGLTEWETRTIARPVLFYRFWRLALKQTVLGAADAVIHPGEGFFRALTGTSPMARVRQQHLAFYRYAPWILNPELAEDAQTTEEEWDQLAPALPPDWARWRAKVRVAPVPEERERLYRILQRRAATNSMLVLPPLTATDGIGFWASMAMGLAGFAMTAVGQRNRLPADWSGLMADPVFGLMAGWYSEPARIALDVLDIDPGGVGRRSMTSISEAEKWMADRMGVETWQGEDGKWRAHTLTTLGLRNFSILGPEVLRAVDPAWFRNPAAMAWRARMQKHDHLVKLAAEEKFDQAKRDALLQQAAAIQVGPAPQDVGAMVWWFMRKAAMFPAEYEFDPRGTAQHLQAEWQKGISRELGPAKHGGF